MDKLLVLFFLIYGCTALPTSNKEVSTFFHDVEPEARIVGGTQAAMGSHPHMVALTTGILLRFFQCGASIVGVRHVLTAAHCVDAASVSGSLRSSLRGTVGTNRWNSGGKIYSFARNVTHPSYFYSPYLRYDIAFLITNSDIQFTHLVRPIALSYDSVGADVDVRVGGWGRIRANGALSPTLLEINTKTIDAYGDCIQGAIDAQVANNHPDPWIVDPNIEMCTFHSARVGNCYGDSGSALMRLDNRQQVGVVSWGVPCAVGGPDIYVRISAFRTWILDTLSETP